MRPEDYLIRTMADGDIPAAHLLSQADRWPHRPEDWRLLRATGNAIVATDPAGAIAGTGMWWLYGDAAASLGMILVAPDRQGAGLGRRLMATILAAAAPRALLLNATAAGLPLYEKLGFAAIGRVLQHQGPVGAVPPVPGEAGTVRPPEAAERPLLAALDARAFGAPRQGLVDRLAAAGETAVLERGGQIAGFALARPFGRGHLIGPAAATDAAGAQALFAYFLARLGGYVRIDLPAGAGGLAPWLEAAGLAHAGGAVAMVRGTPLASDPAFRFCAIAAQALG